MVDLFFHLDQKNIFGQTKNVFEFSTLCRKGEIFYLSNHTHKNNNLKCATLLLNASDERGIETIRDKVTSFSSSASFQPLKIVVLDEADFL